jgi:hypothetical protein
MQSQSEFVPKTYGATAFDQFLEWEELPVIRNFVVGDIRKLEVMPWCEIKPEDLLETRFLCDLKQNGSVKVG